MSSRRFGYLLMVALTAVCCGCHSTDEAAPQEPETPKRQDALYKCLTTGPPYKRPKRPRGRMLCKCRTTRERALLAITVALLLAAVSLSLLQKRWEGRAAIGVATQLPTAAVAVDINRAKVAQVIGVATASVAIATWAWAFYRKESNLVAHLSVLTLLTIFVLVQLLMV